MTAPVPQAAGRINLDTRTSIMLVLVACTAFTSQMAVPLWVGAVIDSFGFSAETAGTIAAVEFTTVAIASYTVALRIHRFNVRTLCGIGFTLLITANAVSSVLDSAATLTAVRAVAGIGKGLVISAAFGLAGRSTSPARSFALLNGGYTLFAAVTFFVVPFAIERYGAAGVWLSLCFATVVGACFVPWMPSAKSKDGAETKEETASSGTTSGLSGLLALLALVVLVGGSSAIWTFIERIGLRTGLSLTDIGMILSAAAVITVSGPALAHALDTRLGYRIPIIAGVGVKIVIAGILGTVTSAVVFIATVPFFNAAMLLAVPYLQALMSLADPKGRFAAAAGASMTLGAALGAYVGGVTVTQFGLDQVGTAAIAMLLLVIVLALLSLRRLTAVTGLDTLPTVKDAPAANEPAP
ncbi:MFS transporter [Elongatibacter sediminis]|uniref:MFS transporter n=1 Tax=Elongatibacter sediminis TaxID=3119006 RepID=A0AAW9RK24_9GAMM